MCVIVLSSMRALNLDDAKKCLWATFTGVTTSKSCLVPEVARIKTVSSRIMQDQGPEATLLVLCAQLPLASLVAKHALSIQDKAQSLHHVQTYHGHPFRWISTFREGLHLSIHYS